MALIVLRCTFLLVAVGVGATLATKVQTANPWLPLGVFFGIAALAVGVVVGDVAFRQKRIDTISAVYFGTLVGAYLSYALGLAFQPLIPSGWDLHSLQLVLGMVLIYLCTSILLQTRNDYRFLIPYVEFAKEVKGIKPYLLDTSAVLDGRIGDVLKTGVLDRRLLMPQFILVELQKIADSADKQKRGRGHRGLDLLNKLRTHERLDLQIFERDFPELRGQPVDLQLVLLAKRLDGKIITNDYSLNKVAQVHGVEVLNLNDLANALKTVYIPGDLLSVRILKSGEEPGQGVGYLEDGTMVVVEGGKPYLHKTVQATVTSTLTTSAGRMIFSKFDKNDKAESGVPQPATNS